MNLPEVGDVFEGRYALRKVLGAGGFATVFLATDREMSRDVVIKALTPVDGGYPKTVAARFAREAKIFTRLQDPHNVTVYHVGESATGVLYMVFEYVEGQELRALLAERGPLPPVVVAHLLMQLLQALREAHGLGILHRDIKPANVLVYAYADDPYRVKLLDYGIAKDLRPDAVKLTKTGRMVGTMRYMAPEQVVGEPVTPASDIYSLGLVGYELLCGVYAIGGTKQREILSSQISRARLMIPPDRAPPALRAVIERMMEREPEARYQSAHAALQDLVDIRQAVVGRDVAASGSERPPVRPRPRPAKSGRWLLPMAAAALVVGVVAGLVLRPDDPAPPRVIKLPPASTPAPRPPTKIASSATVEVDQAQPVANDGCGTRPPFTGLGRLSTSLGGLSWSAYIPTDYDPSHRYPLVLLFHRGLRTGERIIEDSQLDQMAEKHGAILFALDSGKAFGWDSDTIPRVETIVEFARAELCLDPARRYGLGAHIGASMLRQLMCALPMSAAAFAFNGTDSTCRPVVDTPRLKIYGTRDRNVPEEGGMGCNPFDGPQSSALQIEKAWTEELQCSGRSRPWGDFVSGACWVFRDCGVAPLVTCATDGGHQWPGTRPAMLSAACEYEEPDVPFPQGDAIWSFFEEFGISIDTGGDGEADLGR